MRSLDHRPTKPPPPSDRPVTSDHHANAVLVERLTSIVAQTPWLMDALYTVARTLPADACIAAGAIRDTVWDTLTGRSARDPNSDVDVVYYSKAELENDPPELAARLRQANPGLHWEVTNQAIVHLYNQRARGVRLLPNRSLADGLRTWPETATAVGVRLLPNMTLDVVAPLGLDDLFALRLRHNPLQTPVEIFQSRVTSKRWRQRWPELQLV